MGRGHGHKHSSSGEDSGSSPERYSRREKRKEHKSSKSKPRRNCDSEGFPRGEEFSSGRDEEESSGHYLGEGRRSATEDDARPPIQRPSYLEGRSPALQNYEQPPMHRPTYPEEQPEPQPTSLHKPAVGGYEIHLPTGPPEGPYGSSFQASPYVSAPVQPHPKLKRHPVEIGGTSVRGRIVKIFCKSNTQYHLGLRNRQMFMMPVDLGDDHQLWILDESMSTHVKDSAGFPAFAVVNRATGNALAHFSEEDQEVMVVEYTPGVLNSSTLWTESEDMGEGFRCIRMADNIRSSLTALNQEYGSSRLEAGTPVGLRPWKKLANQLWSITPVD